MSSSLPRITADSYRRSRLKGFGFSDAYQGPVVEEGFDRLAATGARFARTFIRPAWTEAGYVLPARQVADLRVILTRLQRRRMYAVIALNFVDESEHKRLWADPLAQRSLIALWALVARIFKGRTVVAGFDVLNEPKRFKPGDDQVYWTSFVAPVVQAISEADPQRVVIVEMWPGAYPYSEGHGYGERWRPQPANVVMSAHLYAPVTYTHADMADWARPPQAFDRIQTLLQATETMLHLRDLATKHNTPVLIGEFSTIQDKPGASEWASYIVDFCAANGWSWSWHYFIGPPIWHPNDQTLAVLSAAMRR